MFTTIRVGVAALAFAAALPGVTINVADTFSDGTTMGWHVGAGPSPAPPTNVATGGPAGVGDAFLQLTALGGSGPGSRLSVMSGPQWAGNYLDAGVAFLRMDLRNSGPEDLSLYLLFEAFDGPGPPVHLALTQTAVLLPAGSGWRTVYFNVSPSDLISGGLGTVTGALSDVDTIRIFHNTTASFPGPPVGPAAVTATLGVDNIMAGVPEPGTLSMLLAGGGLLAAAGLRFRTRK